MSDIKVGDLVMVVKPQLCCGHAGRIGSVFTVTDAMVSFAICGDCGRADNKVPLIYGHSEGYAVHAARLVKIDPPSMPETIETQDEVTA